MKNWKRPKKGDLIWYFGKLMYFEKMKGNKYVFSVPSSNKSKTGYEQEVYKFRDLMLYGNY